MTHGGNRPGSGRKPASYGPTKFMRIPLGCMAQVMLVVRQFKERMREKK